MTFLGGVLKSFMHSNTYIFRALSKVWQLLTDESGEQHYYGHPTGSGMFLSLDLFEFKSLKSVILSHVFCL